MILLKGMFDWSPDQRDLFVKLFPCGMEVTPQTLKAARDGGLSATFMSHLVCGSSFGTALPEDIHTTCAEIYNVTFNDALKALSETLAKVSLDKLTLFAEVQTISDAALLKVAKKHDDMVLNWALQRLRIVPLTTAPAKQAAIQWFVDCAYAELREELTFLDVKFKKRLDEIGLHFWEQLFNKAQVTSIIAVDPDQTRARLVAHGERRAAIQEAKVAEQMQALARFDNVIRAIFSD